jgi:hypothetical protein
MSSSNNINYLQQKFKAYSKQFADSFNYSIIVVSDNGAKTELYTHERSIVFDKDNPPRQYHTIHPTPVESLQCTGGYMAWGGGYELAIGAMAAGASAAKAVDVAALHHWGCGAGCTEFEYDPKSHQWKIISETVYPRHKIRER